MAKAIISSKGQIALPKAIRDRLKLKPGTQLTIDVKGETLVMKRLGTALPDWRAMRGMVRTGPSLTQTLAEEHAAELAREDASIQNR